FQPLQEHTKDRWIRIAIAYQMGKPLPPVELLQIGENYFVRDGHHRISVAKARAQKEIEANVLMVFDKQVR
ncbi:MAG: chromosome partitioning protein ParB, partial [Chloroflexota bacterium]|nr:chromosome partitioning protein ParB [Chloroflexota bacterium]